MVHTLRLDNYTPIPRKLVLGTNSSFGTESIKIERGAGWDGLNLTATWHIPGREEPLRVALLDGDAMDVPPEVTKEAKDGVLVLAGLASGVQRASCNVEYLIIEQAGVYGGADAEPTPELAAQVLEATMQAKSNAEAAAQNASEAKDNANKAQENAEKAQQAAENAAADAAKAGPYAEAARAAQEAAESARNGAIAAQQAAENAAAAAAASKSAADTLAAEAARAAQAAENFKAAANNAADLAGENATAAQQAAATATAAANDAGQSASDASASKAAAETAAKAAQDAKTAAAAAKAEAVKAQGAAQTAAKSAQDAQAAAVAAQKDAAASKAAAANSATAAKTSEDSAAKSAADADSTANSIKDSMTQIAANKEAVSRLKEDIDNIASYEGEVYQSNYYNNYRFIPQYGSGMNMVGDSFDVSEYAGKTLQYELNAFFDNIFTSDSAILIKFYNSAHIKLSNIPLPKKDGTTGNINVPNDAATGSINFWLVYNISENTNGVYGYKSLHIHYGNKYLNESIKIPALDSISTELVKNVKLLDEKNEENAEQLDYIKTRVTALEGRTVPDYYAEHIKSAVETINNLASNLENGTQFVFIADIHSDNGSRTSKALVDYILKNTDVKIVINGGDALTTNGDKTEKETLEMLRNITSLYSENADYYFLIGNHDTGIDTVDGAMTNATISVKQCFNSCGLRKQLGKIIVSDDSKFKYYWDDNANKIRFIACNIYLNYVDGTTWTNNWLWLADSLSSMPDGYTAIILNHVLINSGDEIDSSMKDFISILDAYNNRAIVRYGGNNNTKHDYKDATGKVGMMLCGHLHRERNLKSSSGIPLVAITTDNYQRESSKSGVSRNIGTVSECAFCVVTVDSTNKKIYITGIGAQNSYEYSY